MLDIFIIVVVLWALFSGWRAGFIKEVVSMVGALVGLLVAATCYSSFGEYLAVNGSETNMVTSVIAFFLLWIFVPIVLGYVANVLTKSLKGMKLGMPNSILGALVSALKYLIILSCVLNVMQSLHILNEEKAQESTLLSPVTGALRMCFDNDSTQVDQSTTASDSTNIDEEPDTVWVNMQTEKNPRR